MAFSELVRLNYCWLFVTVQMIPCNRDIRSQHNKGQTIIFPPKQGGGKIKHTKHFKMRDILSMTRKNNLEVPTIDKQKGGKEKALEYSPRLLSGITKESLKLSTGAVGCKQTVTAVKHLLQEVSKVQTFQLQQF